MLEFSIDRPVNGLVYVTVVGTIAPGGVGDNGEVYISYSDPDVTDWPLLIAIAEPDAPLAQNPFENDGAKRVIPLGDNLADSGGDFTVQATLNVKATSAGQSLYVHYNDTPFISGRGYAMGIYDVSATVADLPFLYPGKAKSRGSFGG